MPPLDPDGDLLAAELALGLLGGDALVSAEARLATDPMFAAAHDRWTGFLAERFAPAVAPRPSVWGAVAAGLGTGTVAAEALVPLRRLRRWQGAFAAAAAVAAAMLAVIATGDRPTPPARIVEVPPPLVAVLSGPEQKALVVVRLDAATGRLVAAPTDLVIGAHAAQLWVIGGGGKPRSIGLIALRDRRQLVAPATAAAVLAAGATLAVSVEPIGGSPTGQPTGPVILSGKIAAT